MAQAKLILTDNDNGVGFQMEVEFGDKFEPESQAHGMIAVLAESVLKTANEYTRVEDTAPEATIQEPSVILKPE